MIFLAQIEKEGYVVGEVPKVNNALDEMDSNGIVVSSEHNQALHFLLQPKLYIPSTKGQMKSECIYETINFPKFH